jgi:hypothetical protein
MSGHPAMEVAIVMQFRCARQRSKREAGVRESCLSYLFSCLVVCCLSWLPWRVLGGTGVVLHSTHFFSGTMVLHREYPWVRWSCRVLWVLYSTHGYYGSTHLRYYRVLQGGGMVGQANQTALDSVVRLSASRAAGGGLETKSSRGSGNSVGLSTASLGKVLRTAQTTSSQTSNRNPKLSRLAKTPRAARLMATFVPRHQLSA